MGDDSPALPHTHFDQQYQAVQQPPSTMSAAVMYGSQTTSINGPSTLCGDLGAGTLGWYDPSSYAFDDAYATPFPSSTIDAHPWTHVVRAPIPDISLAPYSLQHGGEQDPLSPSFRDPNRPRSSPSTFGPSSTDILLSSAANGLGIYPSLPAAGVGLQTPPVSSSFPPSTFQTFPHPMNSTSGASVPSPSPDLHSAFHTPVIKPPQSRRTYPSIAPNPNAAAAAGSKRKRRRVGSSDDGNNHSETFDAAIATGTSSPGQQQPGPADGPSGSKKRRREPVVATADLSEQDRVLIRLKEEAGLSWKEITARFQAEMGEAKKEAALQMRYKRLRERGRTWTATDERALRAAHDHWESQKWDIIATRMLEHGTDDKWSARLCQTKWQDMTAEAEAAAARSAAASAAAVTSTATAMLFGAPNGSTAYIPGLSHISGPDDGTAHFHPYMSMP